MIQETVAKEYERFGVHVHKRAVPTKIEKDEATGKLTIHYTKGAPRAASPDVDHLIWAMGRTPATENLGLESAGVKRTRTVRRC